jgi:hypothetical protein
MDPNRIKGIFRGRWPGLLTGLVSAALGGLVGAVYVGFGMAIVWVNSPLVGFGIGFFMGVWPDWSLPF